MEWDEDERGFSFALLGSSAVSVGLYFIGIVYYGAWPFWFLNWNLFLAWIPLMLSTGLVYYLKQNRWVSWQGITLTILWLLFLPNSFYLATDLIHLGTVGSDTILYYVVLLFSFAVNGMILGYTSLYQVHKQLAKRLRSNAAHYWTAAILLLCSFAIYLGRYLRWSTWDIVANPAGVLFDVSDRVINPVSHGQTFQITALFFVLLGSLYVLFWRMVQVLRQTNK